MTLHGQLIRIGDRVWCIQCGWDEVVEIDTISDYTIRTTKNTYTCKGQYHKDDMCPSLFWQEVVTPPEALINPCVNKDMAHLYNELHTIKWWSAEKGDAWDGCVDAICDFIKREYLPKETL
jgi:hypothetical protein